MAETTVSPTVSTDGVSSKSILLPSTNESKIKVRGDDQPKAILSSGVFSTAGSGPTKNYSVPNAEQGRRTNDNSSSIICQERDEGQTATKDYHVMHGQPLVRGDEVADPISAPSTQHQPFQDYSGGWSQKASESDADVLLVIDQSSQLYHALAYNYMIICLMTVKVTPQLNSRHAMALHFGLGLGHFKNGDNELATSNFLKALEIATTHKDDGSCALIQYYLGEIEYSQNKFLAAANYYSQAIQYRSDSSIGKMFEVEVPTLSALHCKQGTTLRYGSRVMEAVKKFSDAIDCAYSRNDQLAAHTNLGNLYQAIGDFSKSVVEYEKTIRLGDELRDFLSLGWAHGNIGNAYLGLSKKDKALEHLNEALKLTMTYEPTPMAIGRALNNLGTAYQALSNNEEAKEFYDQSLAQAVYGNDLPGQARVYGNLGNILMMQERYVDAIAHYSETLSISRDRATQTTAYHNRGCARYERAESERKEIATAQLDVKYHLVNEPSTDYPGLPDNVIKHYRSALSDLQKVTKYHEQTLNNIKGSSTGLSLSVSLFETNSRTFQRLQDCAYCIGQWKQALVFAEQSRARTLGELLLKKKDSEVENHFKTPLDLPQIVHVVKSIKLPVVYMSYSGNRLLVWLLMSDKTDETADVSFNMFQVYLDQNQFDDKSFDYLVRFQLNDKLCDLVDMYGFCNYQSPTMLTNLYQIIAKPLLEILNKVNPTPTEVILIPDSYTRLVPMSALQEPETHYFLGDRLQFHIMNSILTTGVLYQMPTVNVTLPLDNNACCVVGNPHTFPFSWKGEHWKLGVLPFSEKEADRVAFTLGTTAITTHEASKDVVLTKVKHSKIIHLATHGCAGAGFLVFSSSSEGIDTSKFLLFSEDIEKMTTPAALVVLSSCDSARGAFKADGIQGIARSFLLAGAQTVLTSLWRVPDESACYFMHFFYRYLVDGFTSYVALQKACLSIRCYKKYSEYIHWSGYQLQGREITIVAPKDDDGRSLANLLGKTSSFPDLELIQKLADKLIKKTNQRITSLLPGSSVDDSLYKREVQLLVSSPASYPMEVIIDYINTNSAHYTGGIYWIPGHSSDHITAALEHINESLSLGSTTESSKPSVNEFLMKLSVRFTNLTAPALLVLHQFHSLPIHSAPLHSLMDNPYISIIVTAPLSVSTSSFVDNADKIFSRGCTEHNLGPLTFSQVMQRLAYFLLSKYDFHPMNEEQELLDRIQELMCGNVAVSKLCFAILDRFIQLRNGIAEDGLRAFDNMVIHQTLTHKHLLDTHHETTTTTGLVSKERERAPMGMIHQPVGEVELEMSSTQVSTDHDTAIISLKDHVKTRSNEDFLLLPEPKVLLFTIQLLSYLPCSPRSRVLMYCLSIFNGAPFHSSILDTVQVTIQKYSDIASVPDKEDLAFVLKSYNVIVPYPPPIIQPAAVTETKGKHELTPSYYVMPEAITEAVYLSLTEIDKISSCAIVSRTLNAIQERRYDLSLQHSTLQREQQQQTGVTMDECYYDTLLLHVLGLKELLLDYVIDDYGVFGREVVGEVIKQYIKDKTDTAGDYGILQLINYFIDNQIS